MSGITEVLQVMGAMIIFSMILTSTNRYILMNTQRQIETEVEMMAISIAQDIINDARLRAFDATTQNNEEPSRITDRVYSSSICIFKCSRQKYDQYF